MVQRRVIWLSFSAMFWTTISGCVQPEPTKRLNAPPQGQSEMRSDVAEFFAYHNDQGMMADLSIADIHFTPHNARLSGAGEARLERYAELLADTGGTLHYETSLRDKNLIESRLAIAKEFLADVNPGNHSIKVVLGLPGGRGMNGDEALAGQAVAKQPEPRDSAYHLSDTTEVRASGN